MSARGRGLSQLFDATERPVATYAGATDIHPLAVARHRALLEQAELSRRSGVSVSTIYAIEHGYPAAPRTKVALLDALELPIALADEIFPAPTRSHRERLVKK